MNIFDVIKPIKLLSGSHANTGTTGQGCVMNVIAYLNGEDQITDSSPCVCYMVKPILIWFNDYLRDDERHLLIPYIERAMGSATEDKKEIERRAWLCVDLANSMAHIAAKSAEYAAEYAAKSAKYAAKSAEYAAEYAAKSAEYAAEYAAKSAEYAAKYAAEYAAKSAAKSAAEYAAKSAAEYAAKSAKYAAEYAEYAAEYAAYIKAAVFDYLDNALPKTHIEDTVIISRAIKLMELST